MWDYAKLLGDRPVVSAGSLQVWQCFEHPDGDDSRDWSAKGWPDGHWWCFACSQGGSVIDLEIRRRIGYLPDRGKKGKKNSDDKVHETYHEVIKEPQFAAFVEARGGEIYREGEGRTESLTRPFSSREKEFLTDIFDLMRTGLVGGQVNDRQRTADTPALKYLDNRGCLYSNNEPLECLGVCRSWMWPYMKALAKYYGEPDLLLRTGLESRHENYIGCMHICMQDTIVIVRKDRGLVSYYQGRSLRKDPITRYYTPKDIQKMPLVFGEGPPVGAEGFFTVGWLVARGFRVQSFLGRAPKYFPATAFKDLRQGGYFVDKNVLGTDGKRVGDEAAKDIYKRMALSGWDCTLLLPGNGFNQADEWAEIMGYDVAAQYTKEMLLKGD